MSHAGTYVLGELADRTGLAAGLSVALASQKQRQRGYERGRVLTQLAVAIADGATTMSDVAVLRHQPDLFGEVVSTPTVWRMLCALDEDGLARTRTLTPAA